VGLEIVEFYLDVEEAFNIEIPDEDAEHLATVGQVYVHVLQRLGVDPDDPEDAPNAAGWTPLKVWDRLRDVITDGFDVRPEQVTFDARFGEILEYR